MNKKQQQQMQIYFYIMRNPEDHKTTATKCRFTFNYAKA